MGLPIGRVQSSQQTTTTASTTAPIKKTDNEPIPMIKTVDGKFHSGMTADEAKNLDLYEGSFFKTGFTEIDADKNSVLSPKEICDRRDDECTNMYVNAALGAVNGVGCAVLAVGGAIPTAGVTLTGLTASATCFTLAGIESGEARAEQKQTDAYREQYNIE